MMCVCIAALALQVAGSSRQDACPCIPVSCIVHAGIASKWFSLQVVCVTVHMVLGRCQVTLPAQQSASAGVSTKPRWCAVEASHLYIVLAFCSLTRPCCMASPCPAGQLPAAAAHPLHPGAAASVQAGPWPTHCLQQVSCSNTLPGTLLSSWTTPLVGGGTVLTGPCPATAPMAWVWSWVGAVVSSMQFSQTLAQGSRRGGGAYQGVAC